MRMNSQTFSPLNASLETLYSPNRIYHLLFIKQKLTFPLQYKYFFATAGITLFLMGCLNVLSTSHYSLVKIIRLSSFFIVGTGLALLTTISLNDNLSAKFGYGPWPLPTVTLSLLAVLVAMHFNVPHFKNRVAYRRP
jgi:hypothetical protein